MLPRSPAYEASEMTTFSTPLSLEQTLTRRFPCTEYQAYLNAYSKKFAIFRVGTVTQGCEPTWNY